MEKRDRWDSLLHYWASSAAKDSGSARELFIQAKAQMLQESAGNPKALSLVGAMGLFQFMRSTWREWEDGRPGISQLLGLSAFDPDEAARVYFHYVAWLRQQLGDDLDTVLAAYNWGIGNVKRAKARRGAAWRELLPRETSDYIVRVRAWMARIAQEV